MPKVYLVRGGRKGEDVDKNHAHGLAILGYREVESLEDARDRPAVKEKVEKAYPRMNARFRGRTVGELDRFRNLMKDGDIVVQPRANSVQICLGRVKGTYRYMEIDGESRHTREVEWLEVDIPQATLGRNLLLPRMPVCELSNKDSRREFVRRCEAILRPADGTAARTSTP